MVFASMVGGIVLCVVCVQASRRFALLALLATLVLTGCAGSQTGGDAGPAFGRPPAPPPFIGAGSFSASLFKFKTTVEDDGDGVAGGYQEATTDLLFVDGRQILPMAWTCAVTVTMPKRTALWGTVSARRAAEISAKVASEASVTVMHSREEWQPTLFCSKFEDEMGRIFKHDYPGLGGRAKAKR